MLRNSTTKSRLLSNVSSNNNLYINSTRNVHWFHNYKYAGAPRDKYELDNKKAEFGQDEITDKDRNPHLYWGIWQGRAMVQRVVSQFGYSKDLKPEKLKRDFEKFTYFAKLDALHFLQEDRSNYPYMEDDANGAIGYNTDEGDFDERFEHSDYGKYYKDASIEYTEMILKDQCQGRPVYEWQVPYGLDDAYGYKEVSTAVDVLGNDSALNNLEFEWTVGHHGETAKGGTLLKNSLTGQQLLICDLKDAGHEMNSFAPTTVVLPCGAEKLLTSVRSRFSPTSRTDLYGCSVGLVWSSLWVMSEYWPSESMFGAIFGAVLLGLNGTSIFRTFFHPNDMLFKGAFSKCRELKCHVVLGDWLYDDYDERVTTVEPFDTLANEMNDPNHIHSDVPRVFNIKYLNDLISKYIKSTDKESTGFAKTLNALKNTVKDTVLMQSHEHNKTISDVTNSTWIESYRDAINNRRIDLLAHVLNNVEGEKILIPVTAIDDISANLVENLLIRRMTGQLPIQTSPLKFDPSYERVQVEI